MQTNKEVSIQIKVDKKIHDELKKRAKQKQYIFSSYIRRILVNQVQKDTKKEQK